MKQLVIILSALFIIIGFPTSSSSQTNDRGAWYMYFLSNRFEESSWGLHSEIQYRNHNYIGDLDQLLIRSGLQYHLNDNQATFTLGYGYILSEKEGTPNLGVVENRIYQEAFLRQKIDVVGINHRFRFEQRFIDGQDFRSRYRYAVFVTIPVIDSDFYVALYDEVFINAQKTANNSDYFDRNRAYMAIGYKLNKSISIQFGYMNQALETVDKSQFQLSIHQNLWWN